jgi:hypothetical protein
MAVVAVCGVEEAWGSLPACAWLALSSHKHMAMNPSDANSHFITLILRASRKSLR